MKNKGSFSLLICFFCLMNFLFSEEKPIDVVYTWVDGSDAAWQKTRAEWFHKMNPDAPSTIDAQAARRFRDREELRYSLRALNTYAPFVRHIYIVTCGQRPKWLKKHPKITIVSHKDIFKDTSHLPTFNSMAIESNLHHIQGLSERYIYFNDDVFLARPAKVSDFFSKEGKVHVFLSEHPFQKGPPLPEDNGYYAASKNTADLLAASFGNEERFLHAHTPFPSRVSVATHAEALFPEVFQLVSSHRFRSPCDFTITNGIIPYVALYRDEGQMAPFETHTWSFGEDAQKDAKVAKEIIQHPPQFVCIQDSLKEDKGAEKAALFLKEFFSSWLPDPAPWEEIQK
jgi:hypothetical protein